MMRKHWILIAMVALAAIASLLVTSAAWSADADRGRALYASKCESCHEKSVHGRTRRVARDFDDVRRWVARWDRDLSLGWSGEDIDDVAAFLNESYYKYPCPPSVCKQLSLAK